MAKVLTFSRVFPVYHSQAGKDTLFVEKLMLGFPPFKQEFDVFGTLSLGLDRLNELYPKHHTIRAGKRFKEGDKFSPRVWLGKPYKSKQFCIAPDLTVTKTYDFTIEIDNDYMCIMIDSYPFYEENKSMVTQVEALQTLAKNDGLSLSEFKEWFQWGKPFNGQIICWNDRVSY